MLISLTEPACALSVSNRALATYPSDKIYIFNENNAVYLSTPKVRFSKNSYIWHLLSRNPTYGIYLVETRSFYKQVTCTIHVSLFIKGLGSRVEMGGIRRIVFIGGSTMAGYGLNKNEKTFVDILKVHHSGELVEILRPLILAETAFDFFVNASDMDLLVLQIGVSDSLRKRNKLLRRISNLLGKLSPIGREKSAYFAAGKQLGPKRFSLVRVIKYLALTLIPFKSRTNSKLYESNVNKILDLASSRNCKLIVLGSLLGKDSISKFEYKSKKSYTRDIFLKKISISPSHMKFIDTDLLLSEFSQENDEFHLNSRGHLLLADLIKDSIKSFESQQ